MTFIKQHWATITLIVVVAFWIGIRLSTDNCPSCVVSDIAKHAMSDEQVVAGMREDASVPKLASWSAIDTKGNVIASEDLEGKVSVLVYWATWCGGCKKEIPDLVALRNEFPEFEVEIIGLSVDEAHKDLEAFAEVTGINYRLARVTPSVNEAFGQVDSIPTLFIVDQQGRIQFRHTGIVEKEALAERVRALLSTSRKPSVVLR